MKKLLLLIVPTIFILFAGLAHAQDKDIVLYYSTTCPYCKMVLNNITEYKIEESLSFKKVEINSEDTATQFANATAACKLTESEMGYPMLYVDGQCYVGANVVTEELLSLAGIETITGNNSEFETPTQDTTPVKIVEENQQTNTDEKTTTTDSTEVKYPQFSPITIIAMIIGPIAFIVFAYLMIKKLNL